MRLLLPITIPTYCILSNIFYLQMQISYTLSILTATFVEANSHTQSPHLTLKWLVISELYAKAIIKHHTQDED